MYKKRTYKRYVDIIAKETGIPKGRIEKVIRFGNENIVKSIYKGREVRLQYIGNFTFNKEKYIINHKKFKLKKKKDE